MPHTNGQTIRAVMAKATCQNCNSEQTETAQAAYSVKRQATEKEEESDSIRQYLKRSVYNTDSRSKDCKADTNQVSRTNPSNPSNPTKPTNNKKKPAARERP